MRDVSGHLYTLYAPVNPCNQELVYMQALMLAVARASGLLPASSSQASNERGQHSSPASDAAYRERAAAESRLKAAAAAACRPESDGEDASDVESSLEGDSAQSSEADSAQGSDHSNEDSVSKDNVTSVRDAAASVVEELLSAGADAGIANASGVTALMLASCAPDCKTLDLLLRSTADRETPAVDSRNDGIRDDAKAAEARADLLSAQDGHGSTALHYAARGKSVDVVAKLVQAGALCAAGMGWHIAALRMQQDCIDVLRLHAVGTSILASSERSTSPNKFPVSYAGSSLYQRDRKGQTPLDVAIAHRNGPAARLLTSEFQKANVAAAKQAESDFPTASATTTVAQPLKSGSLPGPSSANKATTDHKHGTRDAHLQRGSTVATEAGLEQHAMKHPECSDFSTSGSEGDAGSSNGVVDSDDELIDSSAESDETSSLGASCSEDHPSPKNLPAAYNDSGSSSAADSERSSDAGSDAAVRKNGSNPNGTLRQPPERKQPAAASSLAPVMAALGSVFGTKPDVVEDGNDSQWQVVGKRGKASVPAVAKTPAAPADAKCTLVPGAVKLSASQASQRHHDKAPSKQDVVSSAQQQDAQAPSNEPSPRLMHSHSKHDTAVHKAGIQTETAERTLDDAVLTAAAQQEVRATTPLDFGPNGVALITCRSGVPCQMWHSCWQAYHLCCLA